MSFDDLIERQPITKRQLPPLYPVIFADGETCDAIGLEAAGFNDFVLYDDRLYMPGESIRIEGRNLFLARPINLTGAPRHGRFITIVRCHIRGRWSE